MKTISQHILESTNSAKSEYIKELKALKVYGNITFFAFDIHNDIPVFQSSKFINNSSQSFEKIKTTLKSNGWKYRKIKDSLKIDTDKGVSMTADAFEKDEWLCIINMVRLGYEEMLVIRYIKTTFDEFIKDTNSK